MSAANQNSEHGTLHEWPSSNKKQNLKHTFKSGTLRGKHRLKLMTIAKKTLGTGDIAAAVKLPEGEDKNEWFAMHVVDFYNEISLLYGIVAEIDTAERFPVMGAGKKYEYHWADVTTQKPLKLSAPDYVDRLFTWIEDQLNDERIFPTTLEAQFPANFKQRVSRIFRRLFRVYAHIYYSHFEYIIQQSAQAHVNSCFKHFVLFVKEFGLVDDVEMEPLRDVINELLQTRDPRPDNSKPRPCEEEDVNPPPAPVEPNSHDEDARNHQPDLVRPKPATPVQPDDVHEEQDKCCCCIIC
jgi:MOB kinase activator 1